MHIKHESQEIDPVSSKENSLENLYVISKNSCGMIKQFMPGGKRNGLTS